MKALKLYKSGDIRYEDVELPVLHPGEALLKVKACGICGSDIPRIFRKGPYHPGTILGHEFSGEIVDVFHGEDSSLIGKRVSVFPLIPCQKCDSCQSGQYAQCSNYNYLGSRTDGGFAEYVRVPIWNIVPIPDSVTFEEGAMMEPVAVSVHAMSLANPSFGQTVAIFGAGFIGLILAQLAEKSGASVILADIDKNRIEYAKKLGYKNVFHSTEQNVIEEIKSLTNGRGSDICMEGTGSSSALSQCIAATRTFGRIILVGNNENGINLESAIYSQILRKQLHLNGTWNSTFSEFPQNDWKVSRDAIASGKINIAQLITHKISLSQYAYGLEVLSGKKEPFIKIILKMD